MDTSRLESSLKQHEGFNEFCYKDSLGWYTVGYGRCIDKSKGPGISEEEALYLLRNDIESAAKSLQNYAWYNTLDDIRKCVIIELVFNMGLRNLLGFTKTIALITKKDFKEASIELLNSQWAKQVGVNRSGDVAYRLEHGNYRP